MKNIKNQSILKKTLLPALFWLFFIPVVYSQLDDPVKWSSRTKILPNGEAELIVEARIDLDWHLYTQYFPEGGPVRLSFSFDKSNKYKLLGKVTESPKPTVEYDDIFKIDVKYLARKATFKQRIKILSSDDFTITGSVEGQACYEDGKCVLVGDNLSFDVKGFTPKKETDATEPTDTVTTDSTVIGIDSLLTLENDTTTNDSVLAEIEAAEGDKTSLDLHKNPDALEDKSIWGFFWIAFLAGLLAIFTPCVFPMIPMTVTFFMKSSDNKAKNRFQATIYGLSIIVIYTVIGTLVAVVFGANFANFLSTHWLPNILFFLIFMFFAASFLGMFEITLPNWIVNKTDQQADRGGILGSFFMALTLTVVSFSCTGPLVGAILVQSAGGDILMPVIGMLGFSLAFALPFTLFAFFPTWLKKLPKSGGWLNSVKVILGFIELALGLKFLSIVDQTYHWGILDREIYIALWVVIFTLMGFYLLGKLKLSHDSDLPHISVPRLLLAILTFTFVVYLIPGLVGAPLKALSGYLPPSSTHDFDLPRIIRENAATALTKEDETVSEKPKYSDFLHLPHGLKGYFDFKQGIRCAKKMNKPVFLDFTGHGCVNCREMESRVWSDPQVLKRLKEDYVIIALYVDDKTQLPEEDWITSKDGKVLKQLGKINSAFQIERFNVNAQPYYVLLDPFAPEGKPLVTPRAYNLNVDGFIQFLDDGIEAFNKKKR